MNMLVFVCLVWDAIWDRSHFFAVWAVVLFCMSRVNRPAHFSYVVVRWILFRAVFVLSVFWAQYATCSWLWLRELSNLGSVSAGSLCIASVSSMPNSQKRDRPVVKDEMVVEDEPIAKAMHREYGDVIRNLNVLDDPMKLSSTSSTDFFYPGRKYSRFGWPSRKISSTRCWLEERSSQMGPPSVLVWQIPWSSLSTLTSWGRSGNKSETLYLEISGEADWDFPAVLHAEDGAGYADQMQVQWVPVGGEFSSSRGRRWWRVALPLHWWYVSIEEEPVLSEYGLQERGVRICSVYTLSLESPSHGSDGIRIPCVGGEVRVIGVSLHLFLFCFWVCFCL